MSSALLGEFGKERGPPFLKRRELGLELTVFELHEGRYVLAAKASGPFAADRPFTVSIDPADLTRGLRR